jgi:ribosomal protein S12 methylthiotransferase
MRVQQQISEDVQARKVGRTMKVIIDREEGDYFIGRTEFDSPEVDPEVLIKRSQTFNLRPGQFVKVKMESADEFDLFGQVIESSN